MKKTILGIGSFAIALLIMGAAPERSSSGAPGGHTGAPGEETCATSGCHDDNSVNGGSAILTIDLGSATSSYLPGHTYPVKVKISETGVDRFGFQLAAIDNATNESVGTFSITDPGRTQIANTQLFPNREYVTYTFNGTDADAGGTSEWTVNWTAPSSGSGGVSFHAAAVSANDDMTDKGDHVYTTSKVLDKLINPSAK